MAKFTIWETLYTELFNNVYTLKSSKNKISEKVFILLPSIRAYYTFTRHKKNTFYNNILRR